MPRVAARRLALLAVLAGACREQGAADRRPHPQAGSSAVISTAGAALDVDARASRAREVGGPPADARVESAGDAQGIARDPCTGPQTILVDEVVGKELRVVETRLGGERVRTVFAQSEATRPAIDRASGRAFGIRGFTDLTTGETRPTTGSRGLVDPSFTGTGPLVVGVIEPPRGADPSLFRMRIVDTSTGRTMTTFPGYSPSAAPDGSVLFLRASPPPDGGISANVDILRWEPGRTTRVKRIALSEEGGPYGVSEVVALARDRFLYRVYDEHEHRYYDQNGVPFFKGVGPGRNWDGPGSMHKEQFNLVVAADGRRAAFAERNWNELTYLVVVDMVGRKRTATHFYGSFPAIYGDYVAFVSDPSFVRGQRVAFRQIQTYAIYAYHAPSGTLCEVAQYPHAVQPH